MATTTPFVKRMRTQGGTIYTFSSALEDIGLNINERNNIVKMSHYALLNIPSIDSPDNLQQNKFNVLAIPGAYDAFYPGTDIKDGRVLIAESFQNYALNLETNLLALPGYNPALSTTVSERVFWKWLKETGAIRWVAEDTSAGRYYKEETDSDSSVGYNAVVQCIGQISAGSVRTDTFGTYNETYVLVPTSFGQTPVYFKQVVDDNYYHGLKITNGNNNILGRENYLKSHPDALEFLAYYDRADSATIAGDATMRYSIGGGWITGWWWTAQGLEDGTPNCYFVDISTAADVSANTLLRYSGGTMYTFDYARSNVDCLSIEYDPNKLQTVFNAPDLTFDDLATTKSLDDEFDFNTVLIYYSVYNKSLDKVLATNLLGVLFLDAPSGNTSNYTVTEITLPSITKLQSGPSGFGTSYSFRLNVKSDYMLDDTAAEIVDESTSSQTVLSDFGEVFDNLSKTLAILNQHTGTINYITEQYLDITSNQTNILNQINDLDYRLNDVERDITGTEDTIAMFADGDDPIVDSSIYMKHGRLGFFTNNPTYSAQFDSDVKVKDLIIENAIRDTSGNILLGYGSPLQIGSSTGDRNITFYTGSGTPAFLIDNTNTVTFTGAVIFDGSVSDASGSSIGGGGTGDVTKIYVDGSLAQRDATITNIYNNGVSPSLYVRESSLGAEFNWVAGSLRVDVSVAGGGVSQSYVDGSLVQRDVSIAGVYTTLGAYATNASIGIAAFAKNASLGLYATNASIGLAGFINSTALLPYATNASIGTANFAKNEVFSTSANGLVPATTTSDQRFLMASGSWSVSTDASVSGVITKNVHQDTSINGLWTKMGNVDTSLNNLGIKDTNQDTSINTLYTTKANISAPTFTTSFGIGSWTFDASGTMLRLRYNGSDRVLFTQDGSILVKGHITFLANI